MPELRRRADVVFTRARIAIFVDGCFWHGCPVHGSIPRSNKDWWEAKIRRNQWRDGDTERRLTDAGWRVMRVWEHDLVGKHQRIREVAEQIATMRRVATVHRLET